MSDQLLCKVAELEAKVEHLNQKLDDAQNYIERLECRLEIDHYYVFDIESDTPNGNFRKVEIPKDKREAAYDGIFCRDETIKLQDEEIEKLLKKIEELESRLVP